MGLIEKLRFKPEKDTCLIDMPASCRELFASVTGKIAIKPKPGCDQVVFFAKTKQILADKLPAIVKALPQNAMFWIAWPKKTGTQASDMHRDDTWDIVWEHGYEGVTSVSIDSDWTALRVRHKDETEGLKREAPIEERKVEGIDFINRTVELPADAKEMMKPFKGLEEFFNSMAFTHKKEYVQAIVEAKKPETRLKRIEKTIEMVTKLKEQKLAKQKK